MFQIGLCGVVEADIELFWDSWSVGFLGERLYAAVAVHVFEAEVSAACLLPQLPEIWPGTTSRHGGGARLFF